MKMTEFSHQREKIESKELEEQFDSVIESSLHHNFFNKNKDLTQSNSSDMKNFEIISSIPHINSVNKDVVDFYDYVCFQYKKEAKGIKRTEFADQSLEKDNIKKRFFIMSQINAKDLNNMKLDFYELRKLFEQIIFSESKMKSFPNFLFPEKNKQSLINYESKKFLLFDISAFTSIVNNLKTFNPLKNLSYYQKIQSELYCLNLFYRFLLSIAKPLTKIIHFVHENYSHLTEIIESYLLECLIIENIFYEEHSNQFYFFCNNLRENETKTKSSRKYEPAETIEKTFLAKISEIFWNLFFPLAKSHSKESLHKSFMANFLSSIEHGELSLEETLEILESKHKRKTFINSKIEISQSNESNHHYLFSGKRKLSIQPRYSETIDVNQTVNFQNNDDEINHGQKQKSVKRKLKEKRNTIDVMFQNYFTNSHAPPSFLNHSLEKKGRLFKHEKSVSKSRSKDRSFQSYFENTQKASLKNYSLNYSSSKKKSISSYDPQIKNSRYNLGEAKISFTEKLEIPSVSKTVEIAEINELKEILNDKSENEMAKLESSLAFVKPNLKSSKIYLKSSTEKLPINGNSLSTELNNGHNGHASFLNSKENLFIKTGTINNPSKKHNRRYYYQPNNSFTSNTMDNESIRRLIEDQLALRSTIETEKSREKQILNKSQEKALAHFNREFKKNTHNNEEEKSLSVSKSKEFNVKISKNMSNMIKKDNQKINVKGETQNTDETASDLKTLLRNKRSSIYSREFLDSFSPPKNKNKNRNELFAAQFSPNFIQNEQSKIDDKEFKAKFATYFTTDVHQLYRKSLENSPLKMVSNSQNNTDMEKINKIYKMEKRSIEKLEEESKFNSSIEHTEKQKQYITNNYETEMKNRKVENEYFVENLDENQILKPEMEFKEEKKVSMDRTEKSLINVAKKMNNKNFNVEEIFAEQEVMSKAQEEFRKSAQKEQKEKVNMGEDPIKEKNFKEASEIKNVEVLEDLQSMISPIKNIEAPNSEKTIIDIGKITGVEEKQPNYQVEKKSKNQQKTESLTKANLKSNNLGSNQEIQEILKSPIIENKALENSEGINQQMKKNNFNDLSKEEIKSEIEEAKIIEKVPNTEVKKSENFNKEFEKVTEEIRFKNYTTEVMIPNEKKKKSSEHIKTKNITGQQTKEVKKEQKKVTQINDDEDNELEEIKLAPAQNLVKAESTKSVEKNEKKKIISSESEKSQKENEEKNTPKNKLNDDIKPSRENTQTGNQPPLPPKVDQELYQPQNIELPGKNGKDSIRQNSSKSSQASSYGPHKSVKKIVEEYVFFVNRIGEAVAKSALVSKKVEKVCEWYVGVYFLYKRFFYERRKIEKFLKDGVPKLTRYDEEINKDEWLLYLKSNDRQELLKKVTDENVKITQSIQKMQGKLMARKVPEDIKKSSAISQRSTQESLIAIEAVVDEFDILTGKGMLKDEEILCHCTSLLNACLVLAELDQLVEDIVPISDLVKPKRTPEELEAIAQNLFDLYHGSEEGSPKN